MTDKNSLYVDQHYVAHAEFDDIVFGDGLRDGMVVLIEDSLLRASMGSLSSPYERARADEMNRWCEVSNVRLTTHAEFPTVRFIGRYPDGTMRVRTFGVGHAWIVKRQPTGGAPCES